MNVGKCGNVVLSPFRTKPSASDKPIRVATTRCGFTWTFVEQHSGHARERYERRLLLKERSAPYHHSKQRYKAGGDASDHSLSSWNTATNRHQHNAFTYGSLHKRSSSSTCQHSSSSRSSAFDLMRRHPLSWLVVFLPILSLFRMSQLLFARHPVHTTLRLKE